ncbi:MAG: helix-turn-helix transcriptional regulator, partial [Rhodoferax sp.]|nr:helix-turn-helix transcriptional regulator [Rhodoferax sp.]
MRSRYVTGREQEILMLALGGASNVEIASRLGISHRTVETHKARALRKMGARSVVSL